jgi:spermidine synthase
MPIKRIPYDEVNLSEADGVRYLHLGNTPWIQGAMRIARPWKLEIDYTRDMMCWQTHALERGITVLRIAQLGLGAGSLSKYCWREFPAAHITAVELNPQVIAACRQFFKLPHNDARLTVVQASADAWVAHARQHLPANQQDVLQVDVYDAQAQGPVFDSVAFYHDCRQCLSPQGMMTVNVFGGEAMGSSRKNKLSGNHAGGFKASYAAISEAFEGRCTALPQIDAGNVVVLAWNE